MNDLLKVATQKWSDQESNKKSLNHQSDILQVHKMYFLTTIILLI